MTRGNWSKGAQIQGARFDRPRTNHRPLQNANGARNCFRAPLSPAGARSIWRLPFRLGGSEPPSHVPLHRHCCPLCATSWLPLATLARLERGFRRNLSGGPKGPAIIDRTASPASVPFSCEPGPAAIASPGGGTLVPDRSPKPLLRIPERRIRTAFPPALRRRSNLAEALPVVSPRGRFPAALAIRSRRTPSLFSRVPKTAFGRLAHLDPGPHRLQRFALLFKDLHPDPQPLSPPRQDKAALVGRVAQDLFLSLIHRTRLGGG